MDKPDEGKLSGRSILREEDPDYDNSPVKSPRGAKRPVKKKGRVSFPDSPESLTETNEFPSEESDFGEERERVRTRKQAREREQESLESN